MILLFNEDTNIYHKFEERVSIIIPFFNENFELIKKSIISIDKAKGEKEIIVIDDGSTDKSTFINLKQLQKEIDFKLIRYEVNKGKRYAQVVGFKEARYPIIVTVDSDTIIDKNSIIELIKPLQNKEVGAVTGNIRLLNEKKNFLTRMISTTYWMGLEINKQGLSNQGIVICCSGCLSAYRRVDIEPFYDEYLNQKFMGKPCTYGDDRHLTNLILREGYQTKYTPTAMSYTESPDTLKKYLKQQKRWKQSFWRENIYALKNIKNNKLKIEILMNIFIIFFALGVRLATIYFFVQSVILLNLFYAPYLLFTTILFTGVKNSYLFIQDWKKAIYLFPFALFYDFVLYWLNFYAIFTLRTKEWGTR